MATGGSVESVTFDSRYFKVAGDADTTRDLGGFSNEQQPNGDGSARTIKSRKTWMVSGLQLEIDNNAGDLEFLQERTSADAYYPFVITYVDGNSYAGVGTVDGDLQASSQSATADVSFRGPFSLERQ